MRLEPRSTATQTEPKADFVFNGTGSPQSGRFQVFSFEVEAGELVEAVVNWRNANADVRVFLRDETGAQVDRETNGDSSAMVSSGAATSGLWSVAVQVESRTTAYQVLVNTTEGFVVPEPVDPDPVEPPDGGGSPRPAPEDYDDTGEMVPVFDPTNRFPSPDPNDPFGSQLEIDNEEPVQGGPPTTPKNLRISRPHRSKPRVTG